MRHILLVAGRELRDYARQRRWALRLFVAPLILTVMLIGPALLIQRIAQGDRTRTFTVAVEGDTTGLEGLLTYLRADGLRTRPFEDADRAVLSQQADVGLRVTPATVAALARGEQAPLTVVALPPRDKSALAAARLESRLLAFAQQESARRLEAAGEKPSLATPIVVGFPADLTVSATGARIALSQVLPMLLAFQLFSLMGQAAGRAGATQDNRVLEPLLVLPIARRDVLLGIAAAALALGLAAASVIIVPVTGLVAASIGIMSRSFAGAGDVLITSLAGGTVLAVLFVSVGMLVGTGAHTSAQRTTLISVSQLVMFAVVAVTSFAENVAVNDGIAAIPAYGTLAVIRDGISNGVNLRHLAIAAAVTFALSRVVLGWATKLLNESSAVLRATS